jgi:ABC-type Fe3+ transport system substrate-binding protein
MARRPSGHSRSSASSRLPKQFIDKDGYWVATNFYVYTPALNTELWPEAKRPKTFADLLDPSLKGKMGWSSLSSTSSAPGFVGTVLMHMGEEKGMDFLRKLARQDIVPVKLSARAVVDKMIAGEFAIALQTFNHHSVISAQKGAPSKWFPLDLAMVNVSVEAVTKDAPRPNAARLLVDFLVSPEGQRLFKAADYLPVDPDIPANDPMLQPERGGFKAFMQTPEEVDERLPRWQQIASEIFR